MRAAGAALRRRRAWASFALGGTLAAVIVFVWIRGSHQDEANARASESATSKAVEAPAPRSKLDRHAAPAESSPAPQPGFPRYEDYFNRDYYATYSYTSPAHTGADWGTAARGDAPSPPPSAFSLPSIADVLESAKLLPPVPLTMPPAGPHPELSKLAPAATLRAPASSAPLGPLTNNTPFHLFVTSEPVSAVSSTASEAPSGLSSGSGGGGSAASGAVGAVTGTAGSLTGTAGSLLRR
jgi:hypothetical protein